MSKKKINWKNFFRSKNKFVHLEKNMILISPNCEYNYLPVISSSYFGELLLNLKSMLVLKKYVVLTYTLLSYFEK